MSTDNNTNPNSPEVVNLAEVPTPQVTVNQVKTDTDNLRGAVAKTQLGREIQDELSQLRNKTEQIRQAIELAKIQKKIIDADADLKKLEDIQNDMQDVQESGGIIDRVIDRRKSREIDRKLTELANKYSVNQNTTNVSPDLSSESFARDVRVKQALIDNNTGKSIYDAISKDKTISNSSSGPSDLFNRVTEAGTKFLNKNETFKKAFPGMDEGSIKTIATIIGGWMVYKGLKSGRHSLPLSGIEKRVAAGGILYVGSKANRSEMIKMFDKQFGTGKEADESKKTDYENISKNRESEHMIYVRNTISTLNRALDPNKKAEFLSKYVSNIPTNGAVLAVAAPSIATNSSDTNDLGVSFTQDNQSTGGEVAKGPNAEVGEAVNTIQDNTFGRKFYLNIDQMSKDYDTLLKNPSANQHLNFWQANFVKKDCELYDTMTTLAGMAGSGNAENINQGFNDYMELIGINTLSQAQNISTIMSKYNEYKNDINAKLIKLNDAGYEIIWKDGDQAENKERITNILAALSGNDEVIKQKLKAIYDSPNSILKKISSIDTGSIDDKLQKIDATKYPGFDKTLFKQSILDLQKDNLISGANIVVSDGLLYIQSDGYKMPILGGSGTYYVDFYKSESEKIGNANITFSSPREIILFAYMCNGIYRNLAQSVDQKVFEKEGVQDNRPFAEGGIVGSSLTIKNQKGLLPLFNNSLTTTNSLLSEIYKDKGEQRRADISKIALTLNTMAKTIWIEGKGQIPDILRAIDDSGKPIISQQGQTIENVQYPVSGVNNFWKEFLDGTRTFGTNTWEITRDGLEKIISDSYGLTIKGIRGLYADTKGGAFMLYEDVGKGLKMFYIDSAKNVREIFWPDFKNMSDGLMSALVTGVANTINSTTNVIGPAIINAAEAAGQTTSERLEGFYKNHFSTAIQQIYKDLAGAGDTILSDGYNYSKKAVLKLFGDVAGGLDQVTNNSTTSGVLGAIAALYATGGAPLGGIAGGVLGGLLPLIKPYLGM